MFGGRPGNRQEGNDTQRMSTSEALESIRRRLEDFQRLDWYGDIVIKVERGRIRYVEARPIIRDYQPDK